MKACILDAGSLGPAIDLEPLLSLPFDWTVWDATDAAEVPERIREQTIVLSNKVKLGAESLRHAASLRYISVLATGTNNVALEAAAAAGIAVSNVRHYSSDAVVQHSLRLMLALSGQLISYAEDVARGAWETSPHFCYFHQPIFGLEGKTLGIVGYGSQGRKLAAIARELGMSIILAGEKRAGADDGGWPRLPFASMLPLCDVLSFHCPLTESTRGMLHRGNIYDMKRGALLINCARGGLVDEEALLEAMESGHLGGVGLDVLMEEPPRASHPLLAYKSPHFILTPHIAWASREARARLIEDTRRNIQAFLRGEERNRVTLS